MHRGFAVEVLYRQISCLSFLDYLTFTLSTGTRFASPTEKIVFQPPLPRPEENAPEIRVNLEEDVKISFTFAEYKLVVPWSTLYDSKKGVALKEIKLKFYHGIYH